MFIKLLCVLAVTQALVAATPKKKTSDERITALLVKDDANGELRFLTGTGTFNQLITQKQDLLEQLRPSSGANNNIRPIVVDLNGANTQTTSPTLTSSGSGGGGNSGILGAVASNTSPVDALLPQVVGQVVGGGGNGATSSTTLTSPSSSTNNRRRIVRRGNKRRRVNGNSNNRRRRRRRPAKQNKKNQFVVVRPQRG